jgi:hypothetical protein
MPDKPIERESEGGGVPCVRCFRLRSAAPLGMWVEWSIFRRLWFACLGRALCCTS